MLIEHRGNDQPQPGLAAHFHLSPLVMTSTAPSSIELQNGHPATTCRDGRLELFPAYAQLSLPHAQLEITRIVILSQEPLQVALDSPVGVRLHPGWDGCLGYARYAVEFSPGCTVARLIRTPPPSDPHRVDDLAVRHQPVPEGADAVRQWQEHRRQALAERVLGPESAHDLTLRVPVASNARCESRQKKSDFTLESWRVTTRPGRDIPLLLALPQQPAKGLLVALHGHEGTWGGTDTAAFEVGHADSFCYDFAAAGWAVLQPASMDHLLDAAGHTLLGSWCWDAMACLSIASNLVGSVPTTAVCGLSAGGQIAMAMLALDRRLQAGIVAGSFSTWNHFRQRMIIPPHCDCGTTALLGEWLEQADWLALAAPCPVQIQHGRSDACFAPGADPTALNPRWNRAVMPAAEFSAATAIVRRAWTTLEASDDLEVHLHDGGHAVDAAAAIAWCNRATKKP